MPAYRIHAPLLVLILALPCLAQEPDSFADALKLTQAEATALADVADKSPQLDETAFYIMLAKAARIAERTDQDHSLIDSPAAVQLLDAPRRWRGWPVSLGVTIYRAEKLQGHKHLSASPNWPVNKPVWKLSGTAMGDPNITIVAFSVTDPLMLGEPDSTETDAAGVIIATYDKGSAAEVIGFSYKTWSTKDTEGRLQNYPIVVAWKIARTGRPGEAELTPQLEKFYQTVALGMALLIGYLFLKVYTRRLGKAGSPLRQANRIESAGGETGDVTPQIDPLLKAAAEQYAKDTQGDVESKDN